VSTVATGGGLPSPGESRYAFDLATAVRGGRSDGRPRSTAGGRWPGGRTGGTCWPWSRGPGWRRPGSPIRWPSAPTSWRRPTLGRPRWRCTGLRAGRSLSTARVTLVQEVGPGSRRWSRPGGSTRRPAPGWQRAGGPAGLAPVEDCLPGRPEMPGGQRANLLDHLDLRLDPATVGWVAGRPGGSLDMRGWVRFSDGRAADPLALLQVVDALPPTSFELGLPRLGAHGRADRLPARYPRSGLAGLRRARPALAGWLVRRGGRGCGGLGRPPGRPVPPVRRRPPPPPPAGDPRPRP
jgi:hypothetical protein